MNKAQRKPKLEAPRAAPSVWDNGANFSGAMLLHDGNGESMEKPVKYDLEERTARFGEAIIRFAKKIPQGPVNNRLIDQRVGAGTSIGANY